MPKRVSVFAPASVGNIGPGFDVLGMALEGMGDTLSATRKGTSGVVISEMTGDISGLPKAAGKNTAGIAAQAVLDHLKIKEGLVLGLHKDIPGTGLGSSAASAVAGAYAANLLFGEPLSKAALVPLAGLAEEQVSGALFLDNIGPALMGGITWNNPFTKEVVPLGAIERAVIVLATPDFRLLTKKSRTVLPKAIPLPDVVSNLTYASMVAWAAAKGDAKRFGSAIIDRVAEPARAPLIPGFSEAKEGALSAGAFGCGISGAGATVFAVCDSRKKGVLVGEALRQGFEVCGVAARIRVTKIDGLGARALEIDE